MRFINDGPWLPDDLLTARDSDQVLFFCGAGVSQANAGLPNFPSLAGTVLSSLGSALDSPARRLFEASRRFESDTGLTGVVATDRIFGLLEREFEPAEVREAVAEALRPLTGYGLAAHRTLLDLARDRAGAVRLVTTNFDLLFEECDPSLGSFNPPHLPDPEREKDFRGIVHIHGRVENDYRGARDDEFVLSSADFGRAYLSDGWATRYIRALLGRFRIVFVGYSADDPPVQYLLEALNRHGGRPAELYAFQAGDVAQAAAQWEHKGVRPIPYDSANGHAALWRTLEGWAVRARDVDGWHQSIGRLAIGGPAALQPHQRGMVAHLAATVDGARRLAALEPPPPATWLCVMDPQRRYDAPGRIDIYEEASERLDPFDVLGLDSDTAPEATDPNDRFSRRDVPPDAWDLFASTPTDREHLSSDAASRLRGADSAAAVRLPSRLWHLGMYLSRIAHQPAALWWAAHQTGLHPHVLDRLVWSLRQEASRYPDSVRRGWRLLIAAWRDRRTDADYRRYEIEALRQQEGWSTGIVRAVVEIYRPQLVVGNAYGTFAPTDESGTKLDGMLRVDVEYPRPHEPLIIPVEHLSYAIELFRAQLEYALVLDREVTGHDRIYFDTIRPDDGEQPDEDGFRLTGYLATFVNMMSRLVEADAPAARAEFARWPAGANEVFDRLRIWAAAQAAMLGAHEAAEVFLGLDEQAFWTDRHERDLLYALRDRWRDMSADHCAEIEQRLLTGSYPWPEPRSDLGIVNAHRLNRIQWLLDRGVAFSFDVTAEIGRLRALVPDWQPDFADHAAQPNVGKVRSIVTDVDPAALDGLPVGAILAASREAATFDFRSSVQRRPFRGLAERRPKLALAALTDAARSGDFPEREWATLLNATADGAIASRLQRAIACRIVRLSPEHLASLRHPVSEWLRDHAVTLLERMPDVFQSVWEALAQALADHPPPDRFRRADAGWVDDGLNQPAGRMVDALFKDPAARSFKVGVGISESWRRRLDQLLALPGDARRHAIAMISPHANWLFNVDPNWTERQLIGLTSGSGPDAQAFWGGYFWAARTPQIALYMRLKPAFIVLSRSTGNRRDHANKLAGMLLAGWGGTEEGADQNALIPDVELREILIHADDELRTQMLWYLERWSREPDSRWGERIMPFLLQVWPRQRAVKTARTSGRLADFALGMPDHFPEIVEAILPRLCPIRGSSIRLSTFVEPDDGIVSRHPMQLLDLLWTVLPQDPWEWPYETGRVLDVLAGRDVVSADPRLAELRRRDQQR